MFQPEGCKKANAHKADTDPPTKRQLRDNFSGSDSVLRVRRLAECVSFASYHYLVDITKEIKCCL